MIKNKELSKYVNATVHKLNSLCERYDSCEKYYLRGKNVTKKKSIVKTEHPLDKYVGVACTCGKWGRWHKKQNGKTIDCCKSHLVYTFHSLAKFLKSNNIKVSLNGGTLIGAVRCGSFINYDYDLDMFLYYDLQSGNARKKLIQLMEKWWSEAGINKYLKMRVSLPWKQLMLKGSANGDIHFDIKVIKSHKNGTAPCIFEDFVTNCRKDYDWYLSKYYGSDWQVPKRWCKWHVTWAGSKLCPEPDMVEVERCKKKVKDYKEKYSRKYPNLLIVPPKASKKAKRPQKTVYVNTTKKISSPSTLVWNKKFDWSDCKVFKAGKINRTEALYQQLKKVIRVFNKTNYIIGYGTLLGIVRDNSVNENEVDNDIIVNKNFNPNKLKKNLFEQGLIIFKSGIYRICDYSSVKRPNKQPWSGKDYYSTYTDVYPQLPHILVDPENPSTELQNKITIVQRKFRDMYVNIPDKQTTEKWFQKRYGNWKVPSTKGWKRIIKKEFN